MKSILQLISLAAFVLLVAGVGWLALSLNGRNETYIAKEHPLLSPSFVKISDSKVVPENSILALEQAERYGAWAEIDLRRTKDGVFILFSDESLEPSTNESGFIRNKNFSDLSDVNPAYSFKSSDGRFSYRERKLNILTLDEVFKKFPKMVFVLNLKDNSAAALTELLDWMEKTHAYDRATLISDFSGVLREARNLKPKWLFGAATDEIQRSQMIGEMRLLNLDPMSGDYYLVPLEYGPAAMDIPRLLEELHRRKKKIFVGPVNDAEKMRELISLGVDGILTENPSLFETSRENSP
jgi:glycerophosphoryl diester phosphodiesterase